MNAPMNNIVNHTEEERVKIAVLKAGMQEMLEAVKKGLRFRIVTEEIEPRAIHANVDDN
jgi:hypothetical protein